VPFLRVIRDKRGYETTYLMHWYREGARQRSRILYVFRSPGGVRVGRESLEPDVLRDIEAQYPEIAFDWKAVLDNRQIVDTTPDVRRPRKRRRSEDEAAGPEPAAPPIAQPSTRGAVEEHNADAGAGTSQPRPSTSARGALSHVEGHGGEGGAPRPSVPSAIEGATPDEQTAFLMRWYPIVRERIPQRTADPTRREALLALAERLNPGAWTDADQIAAGLQQAGEALERLSRVFARRRRRARRTRGPDRNGPREPESVSPEPQNREEPASPEPQNREEPASPEPPSSGQPASPEPHSGEGG
jgi:hypothetical protein